MSTHFAVSINQPRELFTNTVGAKFIIGKLAIFLILLQFPLIVHSAMPNDDMRHLPVMVSIPVPGSTKPNYQGTGIYLRFSNNLFFVTAKHVIFHESTSPLTSSSFSSLKNTNLLFSVFVDGIRKQHVLQIDSRQMLSNRLIKVHPNRDLAVILIAKFGPVTNNQVLLKYYTGVSVLVAENKLKSLPENAILKGDEVHDGEDALILGYPVELLAGGSQEVDVTSPVMRKGIIAQKNGYSGKYIVDTGVFGGNSGGPLLVIREPYLNLTQYRVIGIMVQFVPASTRVFPNSGITNSVLVYSGYSVAEPIDGVFELFSQFQ